MFDKYESYIMRGTNLGEFEELVLLAVAALEKEAYGVSIGQLIEDEARRNVTISTIHNALYRLEKKGYLTSRFGGATDERGGRRKRYFQLTEEGKIALQESRELRERMWQLIPDTNG